MKKTSYLTLILTLCCSLAVACSGEPKENISTAEPTATTIAETTTEATTTVATTAVTTTVTTTEATTTVPETTTVTTVTTTIPQTVATTAPKPKPVTTTKLTGGIWDEFPSGDVGEWNPGSAGPAEGDDHSPVVGIY